MNKPFIDFLGIGAQKSGTTWLYQQLKQQDEIFFPPMKEVHFFDMFEERGLEWYESLFKEGAGKIKGEITPAYAILPQEKIKEIYDLNPELRLIFIKRNPIDRAWSAALMDLERAGIKYEEATADWFIRHFNSEGSLKRGDYEQCIANWLALFPEEQLLQLDYDEIKNSPLSLLAKVFHHLRLRHGKIPKDAHKKIFSGKRHPIPENLHTELRRIYLKS